jgi:hypothetical protein
MVNGLLLLTGVLVFSGTKVCSILLGSDLLTAVMVLEQSQLPFTWRQFQSSCFANTGWCCAKSAVVIAMLSLYEVCVKKDIPEVPLTDKRPVYVVIDSLFICVTGKVWNNKHSNDDVPEESA